MNPANDEIDLSQLAVRILRYFQRYLRFLTISTFIGTVLGFAYYRLIPSQYESQMIVTSDILTSTHSERLGESLDRLIKENYDSIVAERLGLTANEANAITSIDIESPKQQPRDTISTFVITVNVKNRDLLPRLQEGLINHLRNNEFVRNRVRLREQMYSALIKRLDMEISSLDSLKRRFAEGKPVYAKSDGMLLIDPTNIHSKIIEMSQLRHNYQNSLELFNSIQLIEGFTPFNKPASPKLSVAILSGFVFGFLAGMVILTLKQLLRMAMEPDTTT